MKPKLILFFIFLLALSIRLYGINWDSGQHLHPDERFLTMIGSDIRLPNSLGQYFDTVNSPLNPYNYPNYQFFVYGTFPLFLTKLISAFFHLDNYSYFHLFGRALSALFDASNIFLLYFLSKKIFPRLKPRYLLLSSILYSFLVLPIQLSHFFAVDTFLTFFITLTFTLLIYRQIPLAGLAFGLALASKISALYFAPVILLFFIYHSRQHGFFKSVRNYLFFSMLVFVSFRTFQPYAFTGLYQINPSFISSLKQLESYGRMSSWFPPDVFWMSRQSIFYPLKDFVLWGLGLPLGLSFVFCSLKYLSDMIARHSSFKHNFYLETISVWIVFLFIYQGTQFAKNMRYFLPIYPFVTLFLTSFLSKLPSRIILAWFFVFLIWPIAFISIYANTNTRVAASRWIYQNIPFGATLTCEHWDDCLPLAIATNYSNQYIYQENLPLFDPDTDTKWQKIAQELSKTDYLIISSNRLFNTIPRVPNKYPIASNYYKLLFGGSLGFKKIYELNYFPKIGLKSFNIKINDLSSDETFTVYDHPPVLIYQNQKKLNQFQLFNIFYNHVY